MAGRASRTPAVALAFLLTLLASWCAPLSTPKAQAATGSVRIDLTGIAPTLTEANATLVVSGTVTNDGPKAVALGSVSAHLAAPTLIAADDVDAWLKGAAADGSTRAVATQTAPAALAPGATHRFRLAIPRAASLQAAFYGVLPLRVDAAGSSTRTFAAYHRGQQYEPLQTVVLLPVTLDPDPDLWSRDAAMRSAAWTAALAPDSRLAQLIAGSANHRVVWAIDPVLLEPTPTLSEAEQEVRSEFVNSLRAQLESHPAVLLPWADADLAAISGVPRLRESATSMVALSRTLAATVGARADLVWPVTSASSSRTLATITSAYAGGPAPTIVVPSQEVSTATIDAPRRLDRFGVLVANDPLSQALTTAAAAPSRPVDLQTLLAYSLVALNDRPGTPRTVVIAPARGLSVDAKNLGSALEALTALPWLNTGTLEQAIRAAQSATTVLPASQAPSDAPPSPLTTTAANALMEASSTLIPTGSVRKDGQKVTVQWRDELNQALSARWRGERAAWSDLVKPLEADAATARTSLRIVMQNVTFAADTGRLQVTVANDLETEVSGLTLTLTSDSPRLRLERPAVSELRIGARSKSVVSFEATALAAGDVTLSAELTGPDGSAVAKVASARVAVSPTGSWIYAIIAGLAAVALVVGIRRTLRSERKAAP